MCIYIYIYIYIYGGPISVEFEKLTLKLSLRCESAQLDLSSAQLCCCTAVGLFIDC